MSLTSMLKSRELPLRAWFEERLGNVRPLQEEFRRHGRQAEPVLPPPGESRPPYSTIGMAVDWRIRHLFSSAPRLDVVVSGMGMAAAHLRRRQEGGRSAAVTLKDAFGGIHDTYKETIGELAVEGRVLGGEDERVVSRWCFVLALFEEVFRRKSLSRSPVDGLAWDASVEEVLALADDKWVDDVGRLAGVAYENLYGPLHPFEDVDTGLVFDASSLVGGADADLLVDGQLIDIKATVAETPSLNRVWLFQLLGYVFLDTTNSYEIDRVGIYLARHGVLVSWPLADVLEVASGGAAVPVDTYREQMASALQRQRASPAPPSRDK